MNQFDFHLDNDDVVLIEYEPVDYDDHGNIEFEIYAYTEDRKEIWDELSSTDQTEIEAQVKTDWKQYYRYERTEAAISRWESERDL
jgi:hypothetical protein